MRNLTLLMAGQFGSRHFGTHPHLADALRATGKRRPRVAYLGVASGDDAGFAAALTTLLHTAGAAHVAWPKLASPRPERAAARTALGEADLVFLGGGDVEAGMRVLDGADLLADVRAAAARGAVMAGLSAGAIMLGERWIRWPGAHASDAQAETYACLGVAPCALDTHGEGDDWQEARAFAAVRARELDRAADVYGVPSGAALVVEPDGTITARVAAAFVFAASPGGESLLKRTIEVSP